MNAPSSCLLHLIRTIMPFWFMTLMDVANLPLSLDGVTSYFEAQYPSLTEFEDENIPKYHLTSKSLPWDPSTCLYSLQVNDMVDYRGHLIDKLSTDTCNPDMVMSSVVSASYLAVGIIDNENLPQS